MVQQGFRKNFSFFALLNLSDSFTIFKRAGMEPYMQTRKSNEEIMEAIKIQMGQNPEITNITVKGHLLQLHVTQSLFHRLSADRERGRKIVLVLMDQMKRLTGFTDVAVWVYSDNEKVIEGTVKSFGGDNVNFLFDL
jgi:hypothetical protein